MIAGFLALITLTNASAATARVCDFVVGSGSEALENYLRANSDLVTADSRTRSGPGEAKGAREYCVHVKNHGDLLAVKGHLTRIVAAAAKRSGTPAGGVVNCFEKDVPAACRDPKWKATERR